MKASVLFGVSALALTLSASAFAENKGKHHVKVENKDSDSDMSVSTSKTETPSTTTTTAANYDARRDVVESRAEQRREERGDRWTAAPQVGAATNGYGFGAGLRAGYTFRTPVYVGGNFMYHSGNNQNDDHAYYPSLEVGYDIGVGPVLFRPYAGAGYLVRDNAENAALLYPGLTLAYLIPETPVFVGADGRVLVPLAGDGRAVSLAATAGVNF